MRGARLKLDPLGAAPVGDLPACSRYMAAMAYLVVFLGAGLGGILRHAVNTACGRLFGTDSLGASFLST